MALPSTCTVPWITVLPVAEATVNLVLTAKSLVTSSVPVIPTFPPNEPASATTRSSPTYRSRPIPAPPPTMRVPLPELVAFVVSNNLSDPASTPEREPAKTSAVLVAL